MATAIPGLKDGEQTVYFQAGGEWCYLRTPADYRAEPSSGPAVPCVIQCHGNRGYVRDGEADWLDEDVKSIFVRLLVDAGIAISGSHATGNHWGRPSAVAANGALFDALGSGANLDEQRIGLMGGGLGAALVWNSATGSLAGRVRAAVLQQATLSYESVIRNHRFKDQLLEAYGIPADTPDDLAVSSLAPNDPLYRTALLVAEKGAAAAGLLPEVLFVHGDADENMLYEEDPVALSQVLDRCGASYAFQTYPGVGHATYDLRETAASGITDFFRRVFTL
jgi:acetyl esterase/lipase